MDTLFGGLVPSGLNRDVVLPREYIRTLNKRELVSKPLRASLGRQNPSATDDNADDGEESYPNRLEPRIELEASMALTITISSSESAYLSIRPIL